MSGSVHALAAAWLLSVFPWARKRRRLVIQITAALSLVLAILRVISWFVETQLVRVLLVGALTELAAVALSLIPLGIAMLVLRGGARIAVAAKKESKPEEIVTRREAIERVAGVTIFGGMSLALGWGIVRGRHAFALEEVVIRVKGWPRVLDGYTIVQVSDVHVGAFVGERELDEGFELVRIAKPDLVVATGDLVDFRHEAIGPLTKRLLDVPARDGAYAILGNHDHYAGAVDVADGLAAANLPLLQNRHVHLRKDDGGGFALLGVDDYMGFDRIEPGYEGPDLAAALRDVRPDLPRILLAHQPRFFDEAAGHVALQLSGHTHGGQINPGLSPARAIMRYVAGRYEKGGSTLYVNRGFGVTGPPSRVGAPPEISKIVIVSG